MALMEKDNQINVFLSQGAKGDQGVRGVQGNPGGSGWSPVFSVITDGARCVLQITDWQGGEGEKPATGYYIGASGLTLVIGDAVDIRGTSTGDVLGPNSATDNAVALFDATTGKKIKSSSKTLPTGDIVGISDIQTISNKSLIDESTFIIDNLDATKKVKLEVSGVTTATTRTLTVPDVNDTLVTLAAAQALTNKTYNKVTLTAPATTATLTIADNKTLTTNNTLALAGTDGTTITFQTSDTYVGRATTDSLTNKTIEDSTNIISFNSFEGFMINGRISVTVASNNLNVAIKTVSGADPSSSSPTYIFLNGAARKITSALSLTMNAGTSWFGAGSSAFATKEIDYFVYTGYNATDGVVIGAARFSYASQYSDFSATSTNEKYCAISTITHAAATDSYHVVGRFAATLSAGAGYTWSVPTFTASNLKQEPIYETRDLDYISTVGGATVSNSVKSFKYRIKGNLLTLGIVLNFLSTDKPNSTSVTFSLPFTTDSVYRNMNAVLTDTGTASYQGIPVFLTTSSLAAYVMNTAGTYAVANGVTATVPHTWGATDTIEVYGQYTI